MLTFNLKKQWFDKIKSCEKTHEYREVKFFWTTRFVKEFFGITKNKNPYAYKCYMLGMNNYLRGEKATYNNPLIKFICGYARNQDNTKILKAKMKSVTIINGKHTDLAIDKDVYDIEFELIRSEE